MKKNVAGQKIGGQMCSAADGSAFTGAVTVYVTGDAGAQAVGSVGAGACTHEGNGYHTYAPAQAETNYDLIGFTFIGSGAIPATIQLFTDFPQTGDSFGLIGTAGAGLTNINLPDQTMNITGDITGNLSGSVGSVSGAVGSVTGAVGSVTGAVGSVTGNVGGNVAGSVASVTGNVGGNVVGAVASVTGNVGGNVVGSVASVTAAVTVGAVNAAALADFFDTDSGTTYASAVAGSLVKEIADNAGGSGLTAAAIADAVWDEDATGHQTQGSFGQAIGDPGADTNTIFKAVVSDAAGATVGVDVVAIKAETASIQTDTNDLQTQIGVAGAGLTVLATAAALATVDDFLDTEIAAIKAKTDNLPAAPAAVSDIPTAIENADALLNRDMSVGADSGSPTVRTVRQALRFLRNKFSIAGSTLTVTKEDDTTASWTAAVTTDAGALPITGSDPAS